MAIFNSELLNYQRVNGGLNGKLSVNGGFSIATFHSLTGGYVQPFKWSNIDNTPPTVSRLYLQAWLLTVSNEIIFPVFVFFLISYVNQL